MEQNNYEYTEDVVTNTDIEELVSQFNDDGKKIKVYNIAVLMSQFNDDSKKIKVYDIAERMDFYDAVKKMAVVAESCGMSRYDFAAIFKFCCDILNKKERFPRLHFDVRLMKIVLERQLNMPISEIDFVVLFVNESLNLGYSTSQSINVLTKAIEMLE